MTGIGRIDQQANHKIKTATVLNGTNVLEVPVDGLGSTLVGIITPASLDSVTMTAQVSADGQVFTDYYTVAGVQISIAIAASRFIGIVASDFFPTRSMQYVLSTNETSDRLFQFVFRSV